MQRIAVPLPPGWLDVISLVARRCGDDRGHIEQRVVQALAVHWGAHGGPAARTHHRHALHTQPVAPVRQRHGRRPQLPPRGAPIKHHHQGQPGGRTREETHPKRFTVPREAIPAWLSSFRLRARASPQVRLGGSDCYYNLLYHTKTGIQEV